MATLANFAVARYEDSVLTVNLNPQVPIGGWSIRYEAQHSFGGISGFMNKWVSSGFNGVSGITITNSSQGFFNVQIDSADTSDLDYGNYAYNIVRYDSGHYTVLTEGYLQVTPDVGG